MKQECSTYLKSISKSKALVATLSDMEPTANFDESNQDGIVNAFTSTIESTEEVVDVIDEEEELMESKFEKMDDQDDIHTAYTKLYKVSENSEKYKNNVCLCILVLVYLGWPLKQIFSTLYHL